MSILIKGMEMPEHCGECKLKAEYDDETFCPFFADNVEYWIAAGRRHEDCPLVPVQKHGRLGDLDDFAKRMKSLVEKAENDGFDLGAVWYSTFVRHIELTPTIIPASFENPTKNARYSQDNPAEEGERWKKTFMN